jgi:ferredoxin
LFKEQQTIDYLENSSIFEATLAADIKNKQAYGGNGKCSTCRVSVK